MIRINGVLYCDKSLDNVIGVGLANCIGYLPFTDVLGVWLLDSGQDPIIICTCGQVGGYIMTQL